jgi:hypothetical protein
MSKQRRIKKGIKQKLKLDVAAGTYATDAAAIAALKAGVANGTIDDDDLLTWIIDPDQDNLATDDAGRKEAIKAELTDGTAAGNILQGAGETEEAKGTDPVVADTDTGGESDGSEVDAGRNPLNAADDVP